MIPPLEFHLILVFTNMNIRLVQLGDWDWAAAAGCLTQLIRQLKISSTIKYLMITMICYVLTSYEAKIWYPETWKQRHCRHYTSYSGLALAKPLNKRNERSLWLFGIYAAVYSHIKHMSLQIYFIKPREKWPQHSLSLLSIIRVYLVSEFKLRGT